MPSRARTSKSPNWFFLQIGLFAIPFIFLAVLAGYLLRRDKASVEQEARERVTPVAEGMLKSIAASLTNFNKHSPPGENVRLELSESGNEIRFAIRDNGPGIPLSEQGRIFERFYRLGSELRRETEGVGIGLWDSPEKVDIRELV